MLIRLVLRRLSVVSGVAFLVFATTRCGGKRVNLGLVAEAGAENGGATNEAGSGGRSSGAGGSSANGGTMSIGGSTSTAPFEEPLFENVKLVEELAASSDSFADENPTLTYNRLEIYFTSNRDGGTGSDDVWMARRNRTQDPFDSPVPVASVNTEKSESSPAISPDGKWLWIGVERDGGMGGRDIWRFERTGSDITFGNVTLEPNVNTTEDDIPRPLGNGLKTMPLASRIDTGIYQTYFATRADTTGNFGTPVLVQELFVDDRKLTDAFLTDDGLTLYFVRAKDDKNGDIYVAHRNTVSDAFQTPLPLTTINGTNDDRDPWLSPDGQELYFVSDRDGNTRIYRATRKMP
ncbi:MAG: hypothetical protein QM784_13165 [Polyangiaceae bacterium]